MLIALLLNPAFPLGDDPSTATPVGVGTYAGDTSDNTQFASISDGECTEENYGETDTTSADEWWSYTAPSDGTLLASTCNDADYDTKLHFFRDLTGLTCAVGRDDDHVDELTECLGYTQAEDIVLSSGEEVLIAVGGYNDEVGVYNLTLTFDAVPDACTLGPDPFACAVVAHAEATDARITEASDKKALRPSTLYNQFVSIGDILAGDSCDLGGTPWAGTYSKGQLNGATGAHETISGSYGGNQFSGVMDDGNTVRPFGDDFSLYTRSMKAIGNVQGGGVAVGRFARAAGRNGVFIMVESSCDDYFSTFDAYFNGALD